MSLTPTLHEPVLCRLDHRASPDQLVKRSDQAPDCAGIATWEAVICGEDKTAMAPTTTENRVGNRSEVGHVLCYQRTSFMPSHREEHIIRLSTEIRAFGYRLDIVASRTERACDAGRPHFVQKKPQVARRSRSRSQACSARSASSSTERSHSSISSGYWA